MMVTAAEQKLW